MTALQERAGGVRPRLGALGPPRSGAVRAVLACAVLAALSAAVLPTVPSYDPWSWIVWGREVFDPSLSFATGGGPSWKPLPVLFTAVYGLFGGAAPTLWVITARTGGLLALVGAWRLAARLASGAPGPLRGPAGGAAIAGAVAAAGVALTQDYSYYMFRGTSEPLLVGATVWAVDRHLDGRRASAFGLAVCAALVRPEAWPFLGLYGLWLARREPGLRLLVLAGFAAIPLLWFVPPWIGSGEPFLAASHAKAYNGHLGRHPSLEALRRAGDLQILPVLLAAAVGVGLGWWRARERVAVALALGALAWIVLVVGMVVVGYPGLERFFLPAAAVICVLAGVGVARVAALAPSPRAAGAVAVVIVLASVPLAASRAHTAWDQRRIAEQAVHHLDDLTAAVAAVGGRHGALPCRSSVVAVNHGVQTALAWKLHVTLGRVETELRHPGLLFTGPHDTIDGGSAPVRIAGGAVRRAPLLRAGVFSVDRVTRPGASNRCVGR